MRVVGIAPADLIIFRSNMKFAKAIALSLALLGSAASQATGFHGDAFNGSSCTYPSGVTFSVGGWMYYGITTNGTMQGAYKSGETDFWYGLNCALSYGKNQTMYFEMKGTNNFFSSLNHAGVMLKATANVSTPSYHGEGPIFWGPNIAGVPRSQIERYAMNTPNKTQGEWPATVTTTDYPRGAPTFVDGVTYRVWVDANLDGVQIWVLDPSSNTGDRSTWIANFVAQWAGASPNQSVAPTNFGVNFFAIPQGSFPQGAQLDFTNIQITN